jgi:hypothetical protein
MRPFGSDVVRARLSEDTTREAEDRQIEAWRHMSSVEIAETLNAAWSAGSQIAWFGLKDRFPAASDDELRARLAVVMLGRDVACRIHAGARDLPDC